jgi:hypothetical protein
MTPTVSIQIVGLIYKIILNHSKVTDADEGDVLIIESLGAEYASIHTELAEEHIVKTAIVDIPDDDDIEIIEFFTEYEDITNKDSSNIGKE